jgi:hypothetical protein
LTLSKLEAGFEIDAEIIEKYDLNDRNYLIANAHKLKKIEHLQLVSDIAEAVRMGYASITSAANADAYSSWQSSMKIRIAKLRGEPILTIWEVIKGRSGTI